MIDEIFLFISLVESGSFSKLSEKLDTNQSTISRRIKTLEDKFGVLLIRTPQGIRTTDAGKRLYDNFSEYKKKISSILNSYSKTPLIKHQITILVPLWISVNVINFKISYK